MMKRGFVISLLIATALVGGCAGTDTLQQTAETASITGTVTDREVYTYGAQTNSTITLGTLELVYGEENTAAAAINADLRAMLEAYLSATADEDAMFYAEDETLTFTHERSYELAYLGDRYVSIIAAGYDDSPTAAHANTYRLGYVYDLTTGVRVELSDLFAPGYEDLIQASIISQITAAGETDNYYPGYADQIKASFAEANWYLKDDIVYVIFNPYQIAPAALGILEFPYPYSAD
jgi:hypothetical protein